MKRKQLVAKSFTSLIYSNFNGRICLELVKLLKLTGAVLQISIKIMLWYVFAI